MSGPGDRCHLFFPPVLANTVLTDVHHKGGNPVLGGLAGIRTRNLSPATETFFQLNYKPKMSIPEGRFVRPELGTRQA